ncbi:MAG: T9SS type A sorting domain-containing protein [Stygiobacter sp.]
MNKSSILIKILVIVVLAATISFPQSNQQCYQCHSNVSLKKDITVSGGTEIVPLYVDSTKFNQTIHKSLNCVNCHTDITSANLYTHPAGGNNALSKYYGSWARFSKSDTTLNADNSPRTRNYYTVASKSCINCHTQMSNYFSSNHSMITKLKSAKVHLINGENVGENYDKSCSRCHATCATCHFKSNLIQKFQGNILDIWDGLHSEGETNYPNATLMTEWSMDWTANIESHNFITPSQLKADNNVCRSCHVGFYKKPTTGFITEKSPFTKAKGTNIKRHPQFYELQKSSAHKTLNCANCHSNVHSYPGQKYDWQVDGDVKCQTCHTMLNHYPQHKTVDCISCHATGFGRSAGLGTDVHDVFRSPENNRVRPFAVKYNEGLSWYPHNIEKPNATTSCAAKCHYEGNLIGARIIVKVENEKLLPTVFALEQNYPNPFNPSTTIKYSIPAVMVSSSNHDVTLRQAQSDNIVTLKVYDILGKEVATLVNERQPAGNYEVKFDGSNLSSGVYFYRLQSGNPDKSGQAFVQTRKFILMK